MKKLFEVIRVANEGRNIFYNIVPRRGVRYQENITWVKPERKPCYHPAHTGDLVPFREPNKDSVCSMFKESKELQSADEKVKKIFSLGYQMPKYTLLEYEQELVEKVKSNSLDKTSDEVCIARLTARIRYNQKIISELKSKNGHINKTTKFLIDQRKKKLRLLRLKDYKKFEWLLEKLDLEYRPFVAPSENRIIRRKSLTLLARLKVEQAKEEKLAAYKQTLDEQKVPFLEKKIMKLKEIKEMEEKYNLPVTVKEEDIQECIEKLEKVKVSVAEKLKIGYKRKIHPYFLEPYHEDLLWKKEKAAELIREKLEAEGQSNADKTSNL